MVCVKHKYNNFSLLFFLFTLVRLCASHTPLLQWFFVFNTLVPKYFSCFIRLEYMFSWMPTIPTNKDINNIRLPKIPNEIQLTRVQ